jgi:hypothetical protein
VGSNPTLSENKKEIIAFLRIKKKSLLILGLHFDLLLSFRYNKTASSSLTLI